MPGTIYTTPGSPLKSDNMPNPSSLRTDRLLAMKKMLNDRGAQATAQHYGITVSSVFRQQRELKRRLKGTEDAKKHHRPPKSAAKILVYDIETAPGVYYAWRTGKNFISHHNEIERPFMLGWAAKWLYDSTVLSDICTPEEALEGDDSRVGASIWQLFDQADVVIAHNGDKFDLPWLNSVWILAGMRPPRPFQTIDTYQVVRARKKGFNFASNRLDYLGQLERGRGKIETNYELWKRCKRGEQEALIEMETYNREDVVLLEEVYLWLRPWIRSHPNMGLYGEGDGCVCANCGSDHLDWSGFYDTPAGRYSAYRCVDCGAPGRSRYTALSFAKRKVLTVSNAR